MPPTAYSDQYYLDGCLSGGIALDIAKDGLKVLLYSLKKKDTVKTCEIFQNHQETQTRKYPLVVKQC